MTAVFNFQLVFVVAASPQIIKKIYRWALIIASRGLGANRVELSNIFHRVYQRHFATLAAQPLFALTHVMTFFWIPLARPFAFALHIRCMSVASTLISLGGSDQPVMMHAIAAPLKMVNLRILRGILSTAADDGLIVLLRILGGYNV